MPPRHRLSAGWRSKVLGGPFERARLTAASLLQIDRSRRLGTLLFGSQSKLDLRSQVSSVDKPSASTEKKRERHSRSARIAEIRLPMEVAAEK